MSSPDGVLEAIDAALHDFEVSGDASGRYRRRHMSTWEQRMSERAKARRSAAEAAEAAAEDDLREREIARWADVEPLPGETRISPDTMEVEHAGHLSHWCAPLGMHACSCGRGGWVVCFVPSEEPPPPCEVCKVRKIGAFRIPDSTPSPFEIVAGVLAQPIRDAFERHLDQHGCATVGHPNFEGGFGHCNEAMRLFRLLPAHEQIILA